MGTDLRALIHEHGLGRHEAALLELARPCVRIECAQVPQGELAPTESRLGGMPHLPAGMRWPIGPTGPMQHVATIRLSDAAAHDASGTLPRAGLLWFWHDVASNAWGFDPADGASYRVTFEPDESTPLTLAAMPEDPPSSDPDASPPEGFPATRVQYAADVTLPNYEWLETHAKELAQEIDAAALAALLETLPTNRTPPPRHRLLGRPTTSQGEMELTCQFASAGFSCGSQNAFRNPKARPLLATALDWRLLLQLDTDDEECTGPGWMWGDMGVLSFWIRQPDLAAGRFDGGWGMVESC